MGSVLGRDWRYGGNGGGLVGGFGGQNRGFGAAGAEGPGHGDFFWFEWGDARIGA